MNEIIVITFVCQESGQLFTGPKAREIAEEYFQKDEDIEEPIEVEVSPKASRMVTIFVCCKYRGDLSLAEDTLVFIKV